MLSNYYGLSQENIVLKEICSQQDYINAWNEMGLYNGQLYNVLLVNITMHGGALWMGEQNGTQYVTPYVIKWKLESKKVERVLLVSCDVGNVDYSTTNIAANIAKKTEGVQLLPVMEQYNFLHLVLVLRIIILQYMMLFL